MRFAISLLLVLAIASIIGTVLKQNEPYPNYLFEFGTYWFDMFRTLGLFDVYHSLWFLVILLFLVISTSFCIIRLSPIMLKEMKSYRERSTLSSLRHFRFRQELVTSLAPEQSVRLMDKVLAGYGYKSRTQIRKTGQLLAAKRGSWNRLGYILTHSAIVIICIGGLIDGNIPLKVDQFLGYKRIETRDMPESQVPSVSRLGSNNLSFRGDVTIPEGSSADVIFLNVANGYLVQELPFIVSVKKFIVKYYSTGQPRLFASDLVIQDKKTGKSKSVRLEVNHPLTMDGVDIYQASFGDGGSHLHFLVWPLTGASTLTTPLDGIVKHHEPMTINGHPYAIEFDDFRKFNVEDLSQGVVKAPSSFMQNILSVFSPAAHKDQELRNVGPSVQFKIRNAQGEAREYLNYMLPITLGGHSYFLTGMRDNPGASYQYIRLPLDDNGNVNSFMQLRAHLDDPSAANGIASRFAKKALAGIPNMQAMKPKLAQISESVLALFRQGGYNALAGFISKDVPQNEQENAAQTYLKVLQGTALEALNEVIPPGTPIKDKASFVRDSLNAMNDSFLYGPPVYLQLQSFKPVMATGLQMTRAPGKYLVYFGSLCLVLGIFAMFYIRERRVFVYASSDGKVLFAMSSSRQTLDFELEFKKLSNIISKAFADNKEL
ncbi:MAG: cytochrome c biogenesis protein ResB [Pseudomonadota bacterium]|nr:cytochrome c biogenesis protein ResB [Pseudomonadota bacterium]